MRRSFLRVYDVTVTRLMKTAACRCRMATCPPPRPGLATFRSPRSQSRRPGSAPSTAAKDAPLRPPPRVGGGCALLPRGLALLASQRTRGAFSPCGGEYGAYGERSGCPRSLAGRKLPADARGGGTADV